MKVRFFKNENAVWHTERDQMAHWNPEAGINPGFTFRLAGSGKWVSAGGAGPFHPSAKPDVEAAWRAHLANLIVGGT